MPFLLNKISDAASRLQSVQDWSLAPQIFQRIVTCYGHMEVDLMASTKSRKAQFFYSWSKADEQALGLDSLSRDVMWNSWQLPYLFPPFPLIAACLNKIQEQAVKKIVMILPFWPGKPWFSDFLMMAISIKRLPIRKDLVVDLTSGVPPPNLQTLKLVVATLSGKNGELEQHFPLKQGPLWRQVGDKRQRLSMEAPGNSGFIGQVGLEYHRLPLL